MTAPHEFRCETCGHFVGGMENVFGVTQPFCRNPNVVAYLKAKPETVVDTPTHIRIKDRYIYEEDLFFFPMSNGAVEHISILGCCGHSRYPPGGV
jgi:hypothetical protein